MRSPFLITLVVLFVTPGCAPGDEEASRPRSTEPTPQTAPSAWRDVDASAQVALAPGEYEEALESAIDEARSTLDGARVRWEAADGTARERWAIKWAAPTADGGTEFVWVRPLHWSPFRIEGRLASPPQRELSTPRALGDLVGFPVDEVVDWMHESDNVREGAFTVRVLENRFGVPR